MPPTTPIPLPAANGSALTWAINNPDAARETVGAVNKLLQLQVKVVKTGQSTLLISEDNAVLTISTKDINLGTITGSKGANAALTSLLSALGSVFTVTNSTS